MKQKNFLFFCVKIYGKIFLKTIIYLEVEKLIVFHQARRRKDTLKRGNKRHREMTTHELF